MTSARDGVARALERRGHGHAWRRVGWPQTFVCRCGALARLVPGFGETLEGQSTALLAAAEPWPAATNGHRREDPSEVLRNLLETVELPIRLVDLQRGVRDRTGTWVAYGAVWAAVEANGLTVGHLDQSRSAALWAGEVVEGG